MEYLEQWQISRALALGFDMPDIRHIENSAALRDNYGEVWVSLFPDDNHHRVEVPLLGDDEVRQGTDELLADLLERYNATAEEGEKVELITNKPKKLKQGEKIIAVAKFLQSIDDPEAWLLKHDLEMKWGQEAKQKASSSQPGQDAAKGTMTFSDLQNADPISADEIDPSTLSVVFSRDPIDIAGMSTGRRWVSCMTKGHTNDHYVTEEIFAGTLVAYVVHKDDENLQYPLMRVLLKPFVNDRGETILIPGRVYPKDAVDDSKTKAALLRQAKEFVRRHNHGKTGCFTMHKSVYPDGQETILYMDKSQSVDEIARAIAGSIPDKIAECITEIKSAYEKNMPEVAEQSIRELRRIYDESEVFIMAYLRNLRDMSVGQKLPKPSEIKDAIQRPDVVAVKNKHGPIAFLYTAKSAEEWVEYMRTVRPDCTHLQFSFVHEEFIKKMEQCTSLTSLRMRSCEGLTDACVASLPRSLTSLDVSGCKKLTDACAQDLPPDLTSLDIGYSGDFTDAFIRDLPRGLTSLDVCDSGHFTDACAQYLPPSLTSLDIGYSGDFTGAFIRDLPRGLTSLDVSGCKKLTDACAQDLPPGLTSLDIGYSEGLTDAFVRNLPRGLTSLDVSGCKKLTDACAQDLPRGLTSLDVSDCKNLTDAFVRALPRSLTSLRVSDCKNLTDASMKELWKNKNLLDCGRIKLTPLAPLAKHLKQNLSQANKWIDVLAAQEFSSITPRDKQTIASRANAILQVASAREDLTPEQRSNIISCIEQIQAEPPQTFFGLIPDGLRSLARIICQAISPG